MVAAGWATVHTRDKFPLMGCVVADLTINVDLHPAQVEIFAALRDQSLREVTLRKGRRLGGTFVTALACTEFAINHPTSPGLPGKPTEIAFYGPVYENAKKIFVELVDSFGSTLESVNKSDLSLVWRGGARGKCYSGENAGASLGSGFDIVVIDEASNFPEHLIRSIIAPTLADRGGRMFIVSSPRHGAGNWFAQRALAAESGSIPNVRGFHFRSSDNPRISRAWLEAQKADTDIRSWDEEYEALILDSSASWLDPSKLRHIPTDKIPPNVFTTLQCDFAWGEPRPGEIDPVAGRRKDFSVMAIMSQDAAGFVYLRRDGLYSAYATPDQAFDFAAHAIKNYSVMKFSVEREVSVSTTTKDMFGRLWDAYRERHTLPNVGMVRPVRRARWKAPAIRMWSVLVERGKFLIEEGAILDGPLREEMGKYSEAASAANKIHDDVLVACADVLLPGIYQGRLENDTMRQPVSGVDIYGIRAAWDAINHPDENAYAPRRSRYGPV